MSHDLLAHGQSLGDGVYWISPAGPPVLPQLATCDMTHAGGGWTTFFVDKNGANNSFDTFDNTADDFHYDIKTYEQLL